MSYTPLDEISAIHSQLRETFLSGLTLPIPYRQAQLLALARMVQENHERFAATVQEDMEKTALEFYAGEMGPVVERAIISATKLQEWSQPEDKTSEVPDWQKGWKVRVYREPKGVALVIGPWNYPLILTLQPLIGAIAAGCCCVVKPSEVAGSYTAALAELMPKYLDQRAYRVVCGGVPETTALLELKWDHIFYTGNGTVARIISAAAAKHLTPLTLELGGKSPVIVDPAYPDLDLAAKRILFGKVANLGQLCVSPDYVLLPAKSSPELAANFLKGLEKAYHEFFPDSPALNRASPALASTSVSRVINAAHFKRISNLLQNTKGKIVLGGKSDPDLLRMEPTVVLFDGVKDKWEEDSLMQGENFAPIIPVIVFDGDIEDAVKWTRTKDHALVLYAFSENESVKDKIREGTMSGNLVFNDTFFQLTVNEIPFGGVGESGHGRQILRYTYEEFTYQRSSIDLPRDFEPALAGRYPPFTQEKFDAIKVVTLMKIPDIKELQS